MAVVAAFAAGCASIASVSNPHLGMPAVRPSPGASGVPADNPPKVDVSAQPATPTPTSIDVREPHVDPGPPFPDREGGVAVYDLADVFSSATEALAESRIAEIEQKQAATIVVLTQYKPGSTARSTEIDAQALLIQWQVTNGLAIMWNTTRAECDAGGAGNPEIQLYAGTRYSAKQLSLAERQRVFDEDMLPLLRQCNEDQALLAALDGIDAAGTEAPPPTTTPRPPSVDGPCGDAAYKLSDFRWDRPYEWRFQERSVPDEYEADEVLAIVERAAENITSGRNDCGLPDRIDAEAIYRGMTSAEPCASDLADGVNSVGFGKMPDGFDDETVAVTCPYGGDDVVVEADIVINTEIDWALSERDCTTFEELLEPTMTHEFGHVFGLSHVSESKHGDLTMSPISNGPCNSVETTLGLGDVLGLEELY